MRLALVLVVLLAGCTGKELELATSHGARTLRHHAGRPSSPERPPVLILALDGVSRSLLYDMLRAGELPSFAELLGGDNLAHADLDDSFVSMMPSTTMDAWVSAMTGVGPADHGVTGNEYFIRETRTFACPAPVSFASSKPTLDIYTEGYLDHLIDAPTVYERIRARDPDALIWIAMNHVFRGADQLLLPKLGVIAHALGGFLELAVTGKEIDNRKVYAALDTGAIESVIDHLETGPTPDVLTLYLYGPDLYAHVSALGPGRARHGYLREVIDPQLGKLVARLRERGMLDRLWIVAIADHGHTEVLHDRVHALGGEHGPPPEVLRAAGFRVRPFRQDVSNTDPFSAVIAYGGATAYVYLADRSQCPGVHDPCPWGRPPRYRQDVLPAAEAFWRANAGGAMAGMLEMILVREPRPVPDIDLPFSVYLGGGKTMSIEAYLREHPHPEWIAFPERMRALAVGVHGERAGDLMLLARDDANDPLADRYYFAAQYHSWHGSPSRADSEIPLIVANRRHDRAEIAAWVKHTLGDRPFLSRTTDLVLGLREGQLAP